MAKGAAKGTKRPGGKPASGGRVTPKGTRPKAGRPTAPSGRYTPPQPRSKKQSPPWVPVVMFALLVLGMLVILLSYLGTLPGAPSWWYVGGGLLAIFFGILAATQYR